MSIKQQSTSNSSLVETSPRTASALPKFKRTLSSLLRFVAFFVLIFSESVFAYTFPGDLPSGCSGSGGTYTCTLDVDINENVTFNDTGNVTINIINKDLKINGSVSVGTPTDPAEVTFNVTSNDEASLKLEVKSGATIYANINITTTDDEESINLFIEDNSVVHGNISGSSQHSIYTTVKNTAVINGNLETFGSSLSNIDIQDSAVINGNVVSDSDDQDDGSVAIASGVSINGDVTAFGDIQNYGAITGCALISDTYSGSKLYLYSTASAGAVCKGTLGSCDTQSSYVTNYTGVTPPNCSVPSPSTTGIIVNAYGSQTRSCTLLLFCTDTFPRMTVYVNGTSYGTQYVNSSSQDYTFSVNLPTSDPVNVDVLFDNDLDNGSLLANLFGDTGDRNLFINSVQVGDKTILPTDSGVTVDTGSGYSAATDGINVSTYGTGMYLDSALRMSTTLSEVFASASLIAEYNFEESTAWNGSTNELKDTSSNAYDGVAIGSPLPTQADSNPALGDINSGTCGYSTFDSRSGGSAFSIENLPLDTSANAQTSVSFWMYWNGTNSVMPIGWNRHDLWLVDGAFGFNTWSSDVYGINSAGLENGWHHVVAVFHNGNVTQNQLYIDGVLQTLSQQRGSPNNTSAKVQSTMIIGGVENSSSYRFHGGFIDELKIYSGELSQAGVTADYTATHACPNALPSFELVAEYHLDGTDWDGTSGELPDTAGYSDEPFNGQTIGSPLPTPNFTSPAISGATGTCGYAELNGPTNGGGALAFTSIPFDSAIGDKNSMSFWLYWDGTNTVLPAISNDYGLFLDNNKLGFRAGSTNFLGVDASSLTNGWHHIAAVFNQGDASENKLYIDGSLQSLSQLVANPRVQKAFFDAGDYYAGSTSSGSLAINSPWSTDNPGGVVQIHASSNIGISGANRSVLDLERYSGDASNIKATVSTNAGDTVYVSFDTAERSGYYSSDVEVYIDNVLVATVATNAVTMQSVEYSAVATSSSTLVELKSTNNDAFGPLVDDIKIETSAPYSGQLNTTIQVGGSSADTTQRLTGRVDEIKFYRGEIDQMQVTADYHATHACPNYVTNQDASGFNCIAEQETDLDSGHLYMQLAGQAFNIKVVALKSDGTAETEFSALSDKSISLAFIDQTNNTPITFSDGANKTSKTITFTTANHTGIATVSGLSISRAYKNLKCQIVDNNQSPPLVATSSDAFSVRPSGVTQLKSSNANADTSNGASVSNTPATKAGSGFNISASPEVENYDGTFKIDHSKLEAHTGAVQVGTLSGSFNAASPTAYGWAQDVFIYSEVGYFRFQALGVYDDSFTQVDIANGDCTDDFSNAAVNGKYGCKFGNANYSEYIGRFVPDHLTVTADSEAPACSSQFTYYGQDGLQTTFSMTAENNSNQTLLNYTGAFAKFDLTNWSYFNFSANNLPAGAVLQSGSTAPSGSWHYGVASHVTATHLIAKQASEMAPKSVTITAQPSYEEGDALDPQTITTISATPVASATPFRYGRLHLSNAYGSELHDLFIPVEAQYWDGTAYRQNTLDTCSTVNYNTVMLDCYSKNLDSGETSISGGGLLVDGKTHFTLSAPGYGNNGSVNLTPYLSNAITSSCANGNSPTIASVPWFTETNLSKTPKVKATFGLRKNPVVYMREAF